MPLIPIALALASFVPDIVKWITGSKDAEAIAGRVVDIAKNVAGTDDPEQAQAAIERDPKLALQFQMAVMASRADLQKMYYADVADERTKSLEDIKDARARDIEIIHSGSWNWRSTAMLAMAYGGIIVISLILASHVYLGLDPGGIVTGFLCTVGGTLLRNIGTAFDFEFGSSRSSRDKTITPEDLVSATQAGAAAAVVLHHA